MTPAKDNYASKLDLMILEEDRVISFGTLSSELKIPVKQAQSILSDYLCSRRDKVAACWVVTIEEDSVRKVSLVYGERPTVRGNVLYVAVWGLVASKSALSVDDWMRCDRLREIRMVDTPSSEANELQDNRWNPIQSDSAGWTAGGSAAEMRDRMEALSKEKASASKLKQNSGSVSSVKVESAEKLKKIQSNKKSAFQFSRSSASNGATKKSVSNRSIGSTTKKTQATSAPVVRKPKRVIQISDDEDDSDGSDDNAEILAMETEAEEAERAAEERNHDFVCVVEADVPSKRSNSHTNRLESNGSGAKRNRDRRKSLDGVDEKGMESTASSHGKRDFRTTFGVKSENQTKYRMVEVEETVQLANGYIGTRRVKKYVDKDGNEKPAEDGSTVDVNTKESDAVTGKKNTILNEKDTSATKNSNKANTAPVRNKKEATQNGKPKGGGAKSTKRGNGSILSFFGKKS